MDCFISVPQIQKNPGKFEKYVQPEVAKGKRKQ